MNTALLVGINDYPGTGNDLAGCVNDASNLQRLLIEQFGFEAARTHVLTDRKATRDAILEGLADLVAAARGGDALVFHYSGHGSQVPDEDDDERADRMDEIICPRDFSWDGCWISDDDLSDVFSQLPKDVHLEVLLDCCHSGTGTREIALGGRSGPTTAGIVRTLRSAPRMARVRYLPPPASMVARISAVKRAAAAAAKIGTMARAKPRGLNHVLWAACKSNQYSADADIGGSPNGAFTWFFCDEVRKAVNGTARSALLARIRKGLAADGFDQTPQLECEKPYREKGVFSAG